MTMRMPIDSAFWANGYLFDQRRKEASRWMQFWETIFSWNCQRTNLHDDSVVKELLSFELLSGTDDCKFVDTKTVSVFFLRWQETVVGP
jgi:hypothetical protein